MMDSALRVLSTVLLALAPSLAAGQDAPAPAGGERPATILILDVSNSMWGAIEGRTKIEIAKETLSSVLGSVPADLDLGFMAYGHRSRGECSDIELIVPPGRNTGERIAEAAGGLTPKGKTPLTDSVRQAAEALRYTEEKAAVVLITDGIESCEGDPCALASELEAQGVDFVAHVVGFGLTAEEGRQVACMAENTGGRYFEAKDAGALGEALEETVVAAAPEPEPAPEPVPAPEPIPEAQAPDHNLRLRVALAEGAPTLDFDIAVRWDVTPVGPDGSQTGEARTVFLGKLDETLEPGRYRVEVQRGEARAETFVDVTADAVAERELALNAGVLKLSVKRSEDAAGSDPSARIDVAYEGGSATAFGDHTFVVPAGSVTVTGTVGEATAEETIALAPGETIERTIVVGTGQVVGNVVYSEAGPAYEGAEVRFDVVSARKDLEGNRRTYTTGFGQDRSFDVPPGDYVLVATLGQATAEKPFSVKAGERTEVVVNVNAGVLAISAPGFYRIDILKAGTGGNATPIDTTFGEAHQTTLPEGEYVIRASDQAGSRMREKAVAVKVAERTEVAVE